MSLFSKEANAWREFQKASWCEGVFQFFAR